MKQLPPTALLNSIVKRGINVQDVVSDCVLESSEDAAEIVKLLSRAAVELNLPHIISELGQVKDIATRMHDILDGVPDVQPVLKEKVGTLILPSFLNNCKVLILVFTEKSWSSSI